MKKWLVVRAQFKQHLVQTAKNIPVRFVADEELGPEQDDVVAFLEKADDAKERKEASAAKPRKSQTPTAKPRRK